MPKIKRLINRLVKWLTAHGISPAEIADCIEYILVIEKINRIITDPQEAAALIQEVTNLKH